VIPEPELLEALLAQQTHCRRFQEVHWADPVVSQAAPRAALMLEERTVIRGRA
jgi:hypothetical protein